MVYLHCTAAAKQFLQLLVRNKRKDDEETEMDKEREAMAQPRKTFPCALCGQCVCKPCKDCQWKDCADGCYTLLSKNPQEYRHTHCVQREKLAEIMAECESTKTATP